MELPGGKVAAALGALAVVGLVGGYGVAVRARPHATKVSLGDSVAQPSSTPHARLIYVHVAGAVNRPGLYELPQGSRVDDAVRAAGGATPDADLDSLNLAAKVKDGDKVLVPKKGASGGVAMAAGAAGAAGTAQGAVVNLNTATVADLDTLPGIGPALAQRIVSYRDAHGGFRTVDDLQNVPGIGPKKLAELRDLVTV